jgi:DNA-binding NarL/FixJ family response regulator
MTIPPDTGKRLIARRPDLAAKLSAREIDVLELLLNGKTANEIGKALFRSPTTAATHIENIYETLGVNSRAQLILAFAAMEAVA